MNLAHIIPPLALPHVNDILGDYHLLLPTLTREAAYRDEYRSRSAIDYLILDNGIAEGRATDFPHLLAMARVFDVQEIVLPDVLHDMDKTLSAVAQAFYPAFEHRHKHRYMFVCQGTNIAECVHSAIRAMNMFPGIIYSFGIPRHILSQGGHARATIATRLQLEFPNKPIHLLGTHPEHPRELYTYGAQYNTIGVRGADTSMAWNATLAEIALGHSSSEHVDFIERQHIDDFRKASFAHADPYYIKLLRENMEVMNSWV